MNNIKELHPKEGVTLLAVKVPNAAYEFSIETNQSVIPYGISLQFYDPKNEFRAMPNVSNISLPEGNWKLLGTPDQITEEVWRGIMPEYRNGHNETGYPCYDADGSVNDEINCAFVTAKQSGLSFLHAHEVYKENPLVFDPTGVTTSEWAHNEANTGIWVIVQKLRNSYHANKRSI